MLFLLFSKLDYKYLKIKYKKTIQAHFLLMGFVFKLVLKLKIENLLPP